MQAWADRTTRAFEPFSILSPAQTASSSGYEYRRTTPHEESVVQARVGIVGGWRLGGGLLLLSMNVMCCIKIRGKAAAVEANSVVVDGVEGR